MPLQPLDIHHELEPNLAAGMQTVLVRLLQWSRAFRQLMYPIKHEKAPQLIQAIAQRGGAEHDICSSLPVSMGM